MLFKSTLYEHCNKMGQGRFGWVGIGWVCKGWDGIDGLGQGRE